MDRPSAWLIAIPSLLLAAVAIVALAAALLRPCCCCCGANVPEGAPRYLEHGGPLGAVPQLLREAGPELLSPAELDPLPAPAVPAPPSIYDRPPLKRPGPEDYPMVPPRPVAEVPEPSSAVLLAIMLIAVAAARR